MATATKGREVMGVCTYWTVRTDNGKTYIATTYPGTDHVYLETQEPRRPLSPLVARKLTPEIKAAIQEANK